MNKRFELIEKFLDDWETKCFQRMIYLKTEYENELIVFKLEYNSTKSKFNSVSYHLRLIEFLDDNFKHGEENGNHYWLDGKRKIFTLHNAMVSLILNPMKNNFDDKWKFIIKAFEQENFIQ